MGCKGYFDRNPFLIYKLYIWLLILNRTPLRLKSKPPSILLTDMSDIYVIYISEVCVHGGIRIKNHNYTPLTCGCSSSEQ